MSNASCCGLMLMVMFILTPGIRGLGKEEPPPLHVEHAPHKIAYMMEEKEFVIIVKNASLVDQAYLYYQIATEPDSQGRSKFESIPMTRDGERFSARLKIPSLQSIQNLEYYIKIFSGKQTYALPGLSQRDRYRVRIANDKSSPELKLLSPGEDESVSGLGFQVKYSIHDEGSGLDPDSIKFYFNGTPFSRGIKLTGNILTFEIPEMLPPGKYSHRLVVRDRAGNESTSIEHPVTIRQVEADTELPTPTEKKWKGNGNLNIGYNSALNAVNSESELDLREIERVSNKTLSFQYAAESDDARIEVGPATFSNAPATPGNRSNKFTTSVRVGNFTSQWVDVSPQIGVNTLNTAMLGGLMTYNSSKEPARDSVELKVACGMTRQGFEPLSTGQAGAFSRTSCGSGAKYFVSKNFSIFMASQLTKDNLDSVRERQNLEGFENKTAETGFDMDITSWNVKLSGNYGMSYHERIFGSTLKQIGYNMGLNLAHNWSATKLTSNFSYTQTSLNYVSLSGGGGAPDRRQVGLQLSRGFLDGVLNLSSANTYGADNISGAKPDTLSTYGTNNTIGLSVSRWPTLNYTNGLQLSRNNGVGEVRTNTLSNNNTINSSYGYEILKIRQNLSANGTYVEVVDRSTPGTGNQTKAYGGTGNYQINLAAWCTTTVNYGHTLNVNSVSGDRNLTQTYGANLNLNFFKGKFTETLAINKNQSFTLKNGTEWQLQNTSYNYSFSTSVAPAENTKFTLNLTASTSQVGRDVISLFPANIALNFQFNMTL